MFHKKLKIKHKMFIGFALVISIMLAVITYSYFSFLQSEETLDSNIETYEFITNTDNILESMINMETAARGYALVGKEEYLEPYHLGKLNFEKHYDLVKHYSFDRPRHQERLVEIKRAHDDWLKWGDKAFIQSRKDFEAGLITQDDLNDIYQEGDGKVYMDGIRFNIDEIISEEEAVLAKRNNELEELKTKTLGLMSLGGLLATILGGFTAIFITANVVEPVNSLRKTFCKISEGEGDYEFRLAIDSEDELGRMAHSFNSFMDKIELIIIENTNSNWVKTGQNEINKILNHVHDIKDLGEKTINHISKYIGGNAARIYIKDSNNRYNLLSSYGLDKSEDLDPLSLEGSGLIYQVALDRETLILTDLPEDYLNISSGLGQARPKNILLAPCIYDGEVGLVLEIGKFQKFTDLELRFIEGITSSMAISAQTILSKDKMEELLETSLEQAEELQVQQEELRQTNEELEEQSKELLAERNNIILKNENLRKAKMEIEEKARDLEITSRYKSEFLANMSHELRTPLNSILVLSQILAEKEIDEKVNEKYLEYASTIHSSGSELLRLINDVLDLSKVEAGKMELNLEAINLKALGEYVERSFSHIGLKKDLDLIVELDEDLPKSIISDQLRLEQILKNLLSNAFKFTDEGQVKFTISRAKEVENAISISIQDTGIGIATDKQADIFDAFKQSDGTISRKYGGTGLGLSISKELADLLGANIFMESEEGRGTNFTLIIPEDYKSLTNNRENRKINLEEKNLSPESYTNIDDREPKVFNRLLFLVDELEDNKDVLNSLSSENMNITSLESAREARDLIKKENFDCLILDLNLKDMSAIELLRQLSQDDLLDMPVIIYTDDIVNKDEKLELLRYTESIILKGEKSLDRLIAETKLFLQDIDNEPTSRKITSNSSRSIKSIAEKEDALKGKKILIIDDDMRNVFALSSLLEEKGIELVVGRNGLEGLEKLREEEDIDLVLMDIMMPVMDGYEAMSKIRNEIGLKDIPIIALTAKAMKGDRDKAIEAGANDYLTKPLDTNKLISLLRVWLYK